MKRYTFLFFSHSFPPSKGTVKVLCFVGDKCLPSYNLNFAKFLISMNDALGDLVDMHLWYHSLDGHVVNCCSSSSYCTFLHAKEFECLARVNTEDYFATWLMTLIIFLDYPNCDFTQF